MSLYVSDMVSRGVTKLSVAVVPTPDFTMVAFAGFIDALRLAADDGDRSRPVRCQWTVLSEGRQGVRASNGVTVSARGDLVSPERFDYVAVVGGLLHGGPRETPRLLAFLAEADKGGVPLVGLCTGSLTLARAGLMRGYRACVSWFHHEDYASEFPDLDVVSDRLFLDEGARITCAGGVSVIHLASHLIERHCGVGAADKGLRIMIEEPATGASGESPQPATVAMNRSNDRRVQRALLYMERNLAEPLRLARIASQAGASIRTLSRLFQREFGCSPTQALLRLRLEKAKSLGLGFGTLARLAAECGFCDAAHLSRHYKRAYGRSLREDLSRSVRPISELRFRLVDARGTSPWHP